MDKNKFFRRQNNNQNLKKVKSEVKKPVKKIIIQEEEKFFGPLKALKQIKRNLEEDNLLNNYNRKLIEVSVSFYVKRMNLFIELTKDYKIKDLLIESCKFFNVGPTEDYILKDNNNHIVPLNFSLAHYLKISRKFQF